MPRKMELTWQAGGGRRAGRWRKKYKGKAYYFPGGRGKTDMEAYQAAVEAWRVKKQEIDAAAPKPHQAEYEQAIAKWEQALAWCRRYGQPGSRPPVDDNVWPVADDGEIAAMAEAKLADLRQRLALAQPPPLAKEDLFEGQFDRAARYPAFQKLAEELGAAVEQRLAGERGANDPAESSSQLVVPRREFRLAGPQPELISKHVWQDRLDVMRRTAERPEKTVGGHVAAFLAEKESNVAAGLLSPGRVEKLRNQLQHFVDWIGSGTPVEEIDSSTLTGYRGALLKQVEAEKWSRTTARKRLTRARAGRRSPEKLLPSDLSAQRA